MSKQGVLQYIPPGDTNTKTFLSLQEIYETSFPKDERRDFDVAIDLIKTNPIFRFNAIVVDGESVGLLSEWHLEQFVFVEHFAVSERLRGLGIGQQILQSWVKEQLLPVVLEVEKPDYEYAVKRIGFYNRIGFTHWPVAYLQPAFSVDRNPVPLHLMTYGDLDLEQKLEYVRQQLYTKVYGQPG